MTARAITQWLWALTCGLVSRLCPGYAFSCFDSNALERRLGSGLLLRHPQVSNQNSKERTQSIRREGRPPGKIDRAPPFVRLSSFGRALHPASHIIYSASTVPPHRHPNLSSAINKILHHDQQLSNRLCCCNRTNFVFLFHRFFFFTIAGVCAGEPLTEQNGLQTILDRMSLGVFSAPVYGLRTPSE